MQFILNLVNLEERILFLLTEKEITMLQGMEIKQNLFLLKIKNY